MSGTEMQREKERVAKMMREKQAAGTSGFEQAVERQLPDTHPADAKKAAEGGVNKKK
jgi:hypothetical protein